MFLFRNILYIVNEEFCSGDLKSNGNTEIRLELQKWILSPFMYIIETAFRFLYENVNIGVAYYLYMGLNQGEIRRFTYFLYEFRQCTYACGYLNQLTLRRVRLYQGQIKYA